MTWLSDLVGQYRRRYLRKITDDQGIVAPRGPRAQRIAPFRLERIYVELRLAQNRERRLEGDEAVARAPGGALPIWHFIHEVEGDETRPLVVVGAPGSGKSTLLRHIAIALAASSEREDLNRAYLPLPLSVREHAGAITADEPPTLAELAQAAFEARAPGEIPPDWLDRKLRRGRCLVLLDGLGDIATHDDRRRVADWIERQIEAYPGSPFVITSRPASEREAPIKDALVLELQPLGAEEVRQFLERWHFESEIARAGSREDEGARRRARGNAEELMGLLYKQPSLGSLARSPLLLSLIATVHAHEGALPSRRVELYAEICEVLLGDTGEAHGAIHALPEEERSRVLEPLAAHMMAGRLREVSLTEASAVLGPALARSGLRGVTPARFLQDVQAASGLLLECSPGRWRFVHRTFQEYLCAAWARASDTPLPFAEIIGDAWWHHTLVLYAALGDATPLLEVCLAVNDVAALSLASECLEEETQVAPHVREALDRRLNVDAESRDRELRRLTASVWMSRRLDAMSRIDARRDIDMRYVTTAEYQLFLDDMRAQGQLFHPDHWPYHRFMPGTAAEPVRGVRAEDATRFVQWLTRRRGGSTSYRLPTVEEAKTYPIEGEGEVAAWCCAGLRLRLVGLSPEVQEDLVAQMRELSTIPPPASFGAGIVRILDVTSDRDLDVDLALIIALALGHALASRLALTTASSGSRGPSGERDIGRRLAIAITRLCERISQRDLTRALAHARARARELDFDRDQALSRALRPAFELLQNPSQSGDVASLQQARAEEEQDRMARAQALAAELGQEDILASLVRRDLLAAYALASVPGDPESEQLMDALRDLIEQLRADGPPALIKAQRASDLKLLENAWGASASAVEGQESSPEGAVRKAMAELTWWTQVVLGRRSGALPAWEGIRLVRDRARG